MTKEELMKYKKTRFVQIVKEEYEFAKKLSLQELETNIDDAEISKEEKRKSKRKVLKK